MGSERIIVDPKNHISLRGVSGKEFLYGKKEVSMGEVIHTSRIRIVREKGPTRRAMIEGFQEPVYYGIHGGIKRFYKVEPEKEHAATLDHIVAATAS